MKSTIGWWVTSEESMVPCVRLVTLPLLLVTFCGRLGAPLFGLLHLRKICCSGKIGTLILLLITSYRRWGAPWAYICLVASEEFRCLHKVSNSSLAFGYILWKVRSTISWRGASEEVMVPCLSLVTLPLLLYLDSLEGEDHHCCWVASEEAMVPW